MRPDFGEALPKISQSSHLHNPIPNGSTNASDRYTTKPSNPLRSPLTRLQASYQAMASAAKSYPQADASWKLYPRRWD